MVFGYIKQDKDKKIKFRDLTNTDTIENSDNLFEEISFKGGQFSSGSSSVLDPASQKHSIHSIRSKERIATFKQIEEDALNPSLCNDAPNPHNYNRGSSGFYISREENGRKSHSLMSSDHIEKQITHDKASSFTLS